MEAEATATVVCSTAVLTTAAAMAPLPPALAVSVLWAALLGARVTPLAVLPMLRVPPAPWT